MGMFRPHLRIILDLLFPPSTHERLLRTITKERFFACYQPTTYTNVISLAPYQNRIIQAAVAACKFEKNQYGAELLACLLQHWLDTHRVSGRTICLPIPLSHAREKERGFNQVTRVLEHIPHTASYTLEKNWIIRPIDTKRQTSLDRKARLENMKGAFTVSPEMLHTNWDGVSRVIICDDVITTGATLEAARKVLRGRVPNEIPIICMAWAH